MEERIAVAAPYPWAHNEKQICPPATRKRKGSGFAVLQQALDDPSTSQRAKEILRNLLGNEYITEETTDESSLLPTMALTTRAPRSLETINPNAPKSNEHIIHMAQEGRLSLLGSIVRVVRESVIIPVPTTQILKTCILAVRPADVPGDMDAKDIVIAALVFLSSSHKNEYWKLPLIRPTEDNVDLEKRSYKLVESPTESQLKWLETAFLSSADKYLSREKYCPRLDPHEEDPLLRKGVIPACAMPMTAANKRKATLAAKAATAASPTPSATTT